jgi:NMD protein affecting ribosome stability and mRNA decay
LRWIKKRASPRQYLRERQTLLGTAMKAERGGFRMQRREQLMVGLGDDPYKAHRKVRGPARCTDCSAVFHRGRWSWSARPAHAVAGLCPACRRIRERLPASFVLLRGAFVREHNEEILNRVRRCEQSERREHPLQRIMSLERQAEALLVTTTDTHLARRIGDAMYDAYKGELKYRYSKGDRLLRVSWTR